MILEIILLSLLGISFGIITGITPGIHINLVAAVLLSLSPFLLTFLSPLSLCCFIIAMSVTHSFLDTLPTIYLGAPDDKTVLGVLPGHRLLMQGKGYLAVKLTIIGAFFGLIFAITFIPLFILVSKYIYPLIKEYIIYILIVIMIFMILREENKKWAFALFLIAGVFGILVFSIPNQKNPLFPMLSGLFGLSALLISYFDNTKIPEQKIDDSVAIDKKSIRTIFSSVIAAILVAFFPGLGPAQGSLIASQINGKNDNKSYLVLVGAVGTISVVFSLITFYTIGKARDGTIVTISKLIDINFNYLLILVFVLLFAGSIAVLLTLFFAKKFSNIIAKINYKALIISIIAFILILTPLLSGFTGIVILLTAASIGFIAPLKNVSRSHAMGCLILPVIFYFLL
jgi:putative membrane protein